MILFKFFSLLWSFIKFNIKLIFVILFSIIFTFVYILQDEIKEFYNLWLVDDVKEEINFDMNDYQSKYKIFESTIFKNDLELNKENEFVLNSLENLDGLEENKLLNAYIEKLNFITEIELKYLEAYELDIYNYLEEGKTFKEDDINSITNKDYLKDFLTRLIVEGNHKIVKEDYVELYTIEIDYKKLINEFDGIVSKEKIEFLQSQLNSSKQYNLRNRILYN